MDNENFEMQNRKKGGRSFDLTAGEKRAKLKPLGRVRDVIPVPPEKASRPEPEPESESVPATEKDSSPRFEYNGRHYKTPKKRFPIRFLESDNEAKIDVARLLSFLNYEIARANQEPATEGSIHIPVDLDNIEESEFGASCSFVDWVSDLNDRLGGLTPREIDEISRRNQATGRLGVKVASSDNITNSILQQILQQKRSSNSKINNNKEKEARAISSCDIDKGIRIDSSSVTSDSSEGRFARIVRVERFFSRPPVAVIVYSFDSKENDVHCGILNGSDEIAKFCDRFGIGEVDEIEGKFCSLDKGNKILHLYT